MMCIKDMATWSTVDTSFAVASFAGNKRTPSRCIPDTEDRHFPLSPHPPPPPCRRRCQRNRGQTSLKHSSACRRKQHRSTTPCRVSRRYRSWRSRRRAVGARRPPPSDARRPSVTSAAYLVDIASSEWTSGDDDRDRKRTVDFTRHANKTLTTTGD